MAASPAFFQSVEEAPVFAAVTVDGKTKHVRAPHKKALIASDTGSVLGIVGDSDLKLFARIQADMSAEIPRLREATRWSGRLG